jgi:molybdopterin converting factor small subunit
MIVDVRYLAQLRGLVGRSAEHIDLPDPCTVAGLVAVLLERHPGLGDGACRLRPGVLVFVGDEQASPERPLCDGDEVLFMAPVAGGCRPGFPA